MNKRILILGLTLLAVTILVPPVMGEPRKAEDKNDIPNAEIIIGSFYGIPLQELTQILPSGVIHNWVYFPGQTVHTKILPRDKFYNPTTLDVEDDYSEWLDNPEDYLGKWVKMSKAGYEGLHLYFGFVDYPFDLIPEEGVYIMGMYA